MDSCIPHNEVCFLVLEETRELDKCDRFVICGVFALCVDQVDFLSMWYVELVTQLSSAIIWSACDKLF